MSVLELFLSAKSLNWGNSPIIEAALKSPTLEKCRKSADQRRFELVCARELMGDDD
jgi:hypothetical protein